MSRVEIGYAVLTITCTAWARIYHRLADRRADTKTQGEPCSDE